MHLLRPESMRRPMPAIVEIRQVTMIDFEGYPGLRKSLENQGILSVDAQFQVPGPIAALDAAQQTKDRGGYLGPSTYSSCKEPTLEVHRRPRLVSV